MLKVTQIKSAIGRTYKQEKVLLGLGLNKLHKTVLLKDTPSIRGMLNKVKHLLKVEEVAQ